MKLFVLLSLFPYFLTLLEANHYEPNWASLDSRPLPSWYDDAKIGIFLHWGVFSVPSYGGAWFWWSWMHDKSPMHMKFMEENYRPGFTYQDFAPQFTAEFYNPDQWADIFEAAGARYIVLTSKHHEGYTLWPSKYSWNWNAMDVGPKRDLVGDLAVSIRAKAPNIHFGLYHSFFEFFNPLYLQDKKNNYKTDDFVQRKTLPELYELVNNYKPDVVWSDGDWEAEDSYWNSTSFLAWLFNQSPVKDTVVVNDRWGKGIPCHHGSFYTCHDKYNPGVLQPFKWENCMTLDKNYWSYTKTSKSADYLTIHELLTTIVETVSCGGNILINTGPTPDGRIDPIMEERLRQMGFWLTINGNAIYKSKPWVYQNDTLTPKVWYTQNIEEPAVYAIVLNWPTNNSITLGSVQATASTDVQMIGCSKSLVFKQEKVGLEVQFPSMGDYCSKWVWVLKLKGVKPNTQ